MTPPMASARIAIGVRAFMSLSVSVKTCLFHKSCEEYLSKLMGVFGKKLGGGVLIRLLSFS